MHFHLFLKNGLRCAVQGTVLYLVLEGQGQSPTLNLLPVLLSLLQRMWPSNIWILWAIRYHLYNIKNVKNTHGGV